ncbi:MAG: hypothetical protein KA273_02065 [Bacteroidales bacterium]|nr:hypothetical protein [Bacteroidales bacterium]
MNIELLAKQGAKKVYTNLAGRTYDEILFKRKDLYNMFALNKEEKYKSELVATIKGVNYVNDAFSTNNNITWFTMEQIGSKIIWIVSNDLEAKDYASLMSVCEQKVSVLIVFGENTNMLKSTFKDIIPTILPVNDMNDAVLLASAVAEGGDVVLYSPANGEREDIEKRGLGFSSSVNNL